MTDVENALKVGERLRQQVASHTFCRRKKITVSLGVSGFPLAGDQPGTILCRADQALYSAKAGGRNSLAADSPQRLELQAA
jgi:diguanylate cyclase (GGDEF)-like protein